MVHRDNFRIPYYSIINSVDSEFKYIHLLSFNRVQPTPDKPNSQGTGKSVRLSEMSDLYEIKNIMQIRHEMRSAS